MRQLAAEMQQQASSSQARYGSQMDETLSAVRKAEAVASALEKALALEQARAYIYINYIWMDVYLYVCIDR